MFEKERPNGGVRLPTEMKLQYRSLGLSPDQFDELQKDAVPLQDLSPGHYIMIADWGRQRTANDLHVLSVNIDHFIAHNPGRNETSDFYFSTLDGKLPKQQLGRDYFLIPADKYTGPITDI